MDSIKGTKIIYDEKLSELDKRYYYNLICECVEMLDVSELKIYTLIINLCTEKDEDWKDYEGIFYHHSSEIKIYVNPELKNEEQDIFFKEVLYHEIQHGVFRMKMILNNNCFMYFNRNFSIECIDEFYAYYNTYYKFLEKYYCRGYYSILQTNLNNAENDVVNNNESFRAINAFSRKLAILNLFANNFRLSHFDKLYGEKYKNVEHILDIIKQKNIEYDKLENIIKEEVLV